jgi:hypothetical protein
MFVCYKSIKAAFDVWEEALMQAGRTPGPDRSVMGADVRVEDAGRAPKNLLGVLRLTRSWTWSRARGQRGRALGDTRQRGR